MIKHLTAAVLAAWCAAGCSVGVASEDAATLEQEINSCTVTGLEWKPYLAHLVYDAADDFGRWEFTTDLYIAGDRLAISRAGYEVCASRGRSGCPAVTAGLSVQQGNQEVHNDKGRVIINPATIRSQLVSGFMAQQTNEANQQSLTDRSELTQYQTFRSPTRTGLPHRVSLTNCAATIYREANFTGASKCMRTGSFRMADVAGVGNDAISSVKVRSGMKVTLYSHDQFGGSYKILTGSAATLGNFNEQTSSIVISQDNVCSAIDSYKVEGAGSSWHKIRAKLVTVGYMRGNDLLDVRLDVANSTVDVDPFNVDFVPPSQVGGTEYGVKLKSSTAETWRSTEDPSPAIFPVGVSCKKQPYGSTSWLRGTVKSLGSYRYCYAH